MPTRATFLHFPSTALVAVALALGCSGSDSVAPAPAPVASLLFGGSADSVVLGQTHQLSVTTRDASNRTLAGRFVTWSVADTTIARVSEQGLVTGLQLGSTLATATSEGKSASLPLNVTRVPVARVAFSVGPQTLTVGDSSVLAVTVSDASGTLLTDRVVSYSSASPTVLSINSNGLMHALAAGTSVVTAIVDGRSTDQLPMTVKSLPVASIVITPRTLDVAPGATGTLTFRAADVNGNPASSATTLTFVSSNPGVLTVQPNGSFVAAAIGTATVTVTSGTATGTVPVTVQDLQPGTFHFDLRFVGPEDPDIVAAAQAAAARWERVLPVALVSQSVNLAAGACETLAPAISGTTTGIIVTIAKDSIDGKSRTLAEAGPCLMRSDGLFVAAGAVDLDSADVALMVQRGTLANVIAHELGHVLGIGTIWDDGAVRQLLADTAGLDPRYTGAAAVHGALDIGFLGADSTRGVEVENVGGPGSRLGHWRESVYGSELMTSIDGPGNRTPLSRITVGSLHDLGFVTREAGAEFFSGATASSGGLSVSSGVSASIVPPPGARVDHEILRYPRFIATPYGKTVPLRQPRVTRQ